MVVLGLKRIECRVFQEICRTPSHRLRVKNNKARADSSCYHGYATKTAMKTVPLM